MLSTIILLPFLNASRRPKRRLKRDIRSVSRHRIVFEEIVVVLNHLHGPTLGLICYILLIHGFREHPYEANNHTLKSRRLLPKYPRQEIPCPTVFQNRQGHKKDIFGRMREFSTSSHVLIPIYEILKPSPDSNKLRRAKVCHLKNCGGPTLFVEFVENRCVRSVFLVAVFGAPSNSSSSLRRSMAAVERSCKAWAASEEVKEEAISKRGGVRWGRGCWCEARSGKDCAVVGER